MTRVRCASCGQKVAPYEIMHSGSAETGYRKICNQCFNTEVAEADGLHKFQHVKFAPVELADCTGASHIFHFRVRLFGIGVAIDGFEVHEGYPTGYRYEIIADPEDDLMVLLGQLIEKIRRGLSIKHLIKDQSGWQIADHRVVRGIIGTDPARRHLTPLLEIDGRQVTWQEFGRMLVTLEGWQFKMDIRDRSDEV